MRAIEYASKMVSADTTLARSHIACAASSRELVEIMGQIDLALEGAERVGDRTAALHGDKPSNSSHGRRHRR